MLGVEACAGGTSPGSMKGYMVDEDIPSPGSPVLMEANSLSSSVKLSSRPNLVEVSVTWGNLLFSVVTDMVVEADTPDGTLSVAMLIMGGGLAPMSRDLVEDFMVLLVGRGVVKGVVVTVVVVVDLVVVDFVVLDICNSSSGWNISLLRSKGISPSLPIARNSAVVVVTVVVVVVVVDVIVVVGEEVVVVVVLVVVVGMIVVVGIVDLADVTFGDAVATVVF